MLRHWSIRMQVVREHDPDGRDVELFRRHFYSGGKGPAMKGSKGAEMADGLVVKDEDYKVVKTRFSSFFATNLDSVLKTSGIKNLVVVGNYKHVLLYILDPSFYFLVLPTVFLPKKLLNIQGFRRRIVSGRLSLMLSHWTIRRLRLLLMQQPLLIKKSICVRTQSYRTVLLSFSTLWFRFRVFSSLAYSTSMLVRCQKLNLLIYL